MRAIDVHVHPLNPSFERAAGVFLPAARRLFGGGWEVRSNEEIADEFRRDDCMAIPIAWDAMHGAGGNVVSNEEIALLHKQSPDVFLPGWAMVDPWRGRDGLEKIEHAIRGLGMLGVKYQPPVQRFLPDDRQFYPIWDLLQSLGASVLMHCGTTAIGSGEMGGLGYKIDGGRPYRIDNIAADFPKLNIVAAHPGWPWTDELIAVALHKKNVSIDISGWTIRHFPQSLKYDMQRRLQDKVMFGSDYPGWSPGQCCDEWEMEGFSSAIIEKLFVKNALRILNLNEAVKQGLESKKRLAGEAAAR